MRKNIRKTALLLVMLLTAALLLPACGDVEPRDGGNTGKNKVTQGAKSTGTPKDDDNKNKDPLDNKTPSDPTPTEEAKNSPTPTEEAKNDSTDAPKDTDFQDPEDNQKEYTTANKLWRIYENKDDESSMTWYLYLDIDLDKGYVQYWHDYVNTMTFSSTDWPIKDGLMFVSSYTGNPEDMPGVWQVYLKYSKSCIRLYSVDDEGNVETDGYIEFRFKSEDVIKR